MPHLRAEDGYPKATYRISRTMVSTMPMEPCDWSALADELKAAFLHAFDVAAREIAGPCVEYTLLGQPEISSWIEPWDCTVRFKGTAIYNIPVKGRLIFKV